MNRGILDRTIVAPATSIGGAIVVIRLSGADSCAVVESMFSKPLVHRTAVFGAIVNEVGELVDEVLCTYFAAPNSYTGEHCVEISCHGSAWIVGEIIRLAVQGGATVAGAGDFSKRAFLNGKIDLSQAEAVADLIMSESRASAKVALQQMRGGYKVELQSIRDKLLNVTSLLTLELDFSEEDVQFADRAELRALLGQIIEKCDALCGSFKMGNAIKSGVSVAIVGRPNVGKSTLLNALVGEERSIVSDIAGTTRDYVEQYFTIDGVRFRFIDTAGIRGLDKTSDSVEDEGIRRSVEQAKNADIVLYLTVPKAVDELILSDALTVFGKCDTYVERGDGLYISARSGEGMGDLRAKLVELSGMRGADGGALMVTNVRHFEALQSAGELFKRAFEELNFDSEPDKVCALLRGGLDVLAEITGEITTDELLSTIFSRFCIGK